MKYTVYLLAVCAAVFTGMGVVELYPLLGPLVGGDSVSRSVDVNKGGISLMLGVYCLVRVYFIRKELQKRTQHNEVI